MLTTSSANTWPAPPHSTSPQAPARQPSHRACRKAASSSSHLAQSLHGSLTLTRLAHGGSTRACTKARRRGDTTTAGTAGAPENKLADSTTGYYTADCYTARLREHYQGASQRPWMHRCHAQGQEGRAFMARMSSSSKAFTSPQTPTGPTQSRRLVGR